MPFFFKQWGRWKPIPENTDTSSYEDFPRRVGLYASFYKPHGIRAIAKFYADPQKNCLNMMRMKGKDHAGRMLDGREWSEFPEVRS